MSENIQDLAQAQLDLFFQRIDGFHRLEDDALRFEVLRVAHYSQVFREPSAPFSQLDMADVPRALDALCTLAVAQANRPTCEAVAIGSLLGLDSTYGRIPAIMARQYGECVAAIDQNINLTHYATLLANKDFPSGGDETRLDEAQALGQTYALCPRLFPIIHGEKTERVLAALGRIKPQEVEKKQYGQENRYNQLMLVREDVVPALSGILEHPPVKLVHTYNISVEDQKRCNGTLHAMCNALSVLDAWGIEQEPTASREALAQWMEAGTRENLNYSKFASLKSGFTRLTRIALAAHAQNTDPEAKPRIPKI